MRITIFACIEQYGTLWQTGQNARTKHAKTKIYYIEAKIFPLDKN